jgi:hypothetical protein
MIASAVTDFPEPDSPTTASVRPDLTSKLNSLTARPDSPKFTLKPRTERSGEDSGLEAAIPASSDITFLSGAKHVAWFRNCGEAFRFSSAPTARPPEDRVSPPSSRKLLPL